MGSKDRGPELERAIGQMYRKTKDLRRQLRKAVVDHVSDSFLETTMPLLDLIEVIIISNNLISFTNLSHLHL
jgi:catenin alpha